MFVPVCLFLSFSFSIHSFMGCWLYECTIFSTVTRSKVRRETDKFRFGSVRFRSVEGISGNFCQTESFRVAGRLFRRPRFSPKTSIKNESLSSIATQRDSVVFPSELLAAAVAAAAAAAAVAVCSTRGYCWFPACFRRVYCICT